ncbi:MAG TPA: hypothetical protein VN721_16120 [Flavipsychrobacter sp.]|nr:hypothetical protein [Flavipsychrobacter sp.]
MASNNYISIIEFVHQDWETSIDLGKLADNLLQGGQVLKLREITVAKGSKYLIKVDENSFQFSSKEILEFFYAFNLINKRAKEIQTADAWAIFFDELSSRKYKEFSKKLSYEFFNLVVLISNKLFHFAITKLILNKKKINPILEASFWYALPFAEGETSALVATSFAITEGYKAEDNYFNINNAVKERSRLDPNFGKLLIDSSKKNTSQLHFFCRFAFIGLNEALGFNQTFPLLKELLLSENIDFRRAGLHSLSMLSSEKDSLGDKETEIMSILDPMESKKDNNLISDLVFLYGFLIDKLSNARDKLYLIPITYSSEKCLYALARIISIKFQEEKFSKWMTSGLGLLAKSSEISTQSYKIIAGLFQEIINTDSQTIFQYFKLFIEHENNDLNNIEAFTQVFYCLAKNQIDLLEMWLTIWFNSENVRFHIVASKILNYLWVNKIHEIRLHKETINTYSPYDIEFILFKIAGYVHSKDHLESLIFSALSYDGEAQLIEKLVTSLFCYYIVYNYPSAIKYLKSKLEQANEAEARVIKTIQQFYDETYGVNLEKPKELLPSADRLHKFSRNIFKDIDIYKNKSPYNETSFLDLAHKVLLKNGTSFFLRNDDYGTPNRYSRKSVLHQMSHRLEFPSGEFLDPIGQEYKRFLWRKLKRRIA